MSVSYTYVNYVDCGTAVARTNKVNTNAFDESSIFRDVYINILCKLCRLWTTVALDLKRARVARYSEV